MDLIRDNYGQQINQMNSKVASLSLSQERLRGGEKRKFLTELFKRTQQLQKNACMSQRDKAVNYGSCTI